MSTEKITNSNSPPTPTTIFGALLQKATAVLLDFAQNREVVRITFVGANLEDLKQFQNELLKIGIEDSSERGHVRKPEYSKSGDTYTISLISDEYNTIMDNKNAYAELVSSTQSSAGTGPSSSITNSPQMTTTIVGKLNNPALDRPWHFDPETKAQRPANTNVYKLVEATDKDKRKVIQFYEHHPISGYEIGSVQVIYNPNMNHKFQLHLHELQQHDNNLAFKAKWSTGQESKYDLVEDQEKIAWRTKVHQQFIDLARPYQDSDYPAVNLLPMWHGTKAEVVDSICRTGYAALATTDCGFFGRGIYGAYEAEYSYRVYAKKTGALILNWTATFSAYPVIDGDMKKFVMINSEGKEVSIGNYSNYDAHFAPVVPANPLNLNETIYYPTKPNQLHIYTELVVFQKAACLPRYLVQLQPTLLKSLPVPQVQPTKPEVLPEGIVLDSVGWSSSETNSPPTTASTSITANTTTKLGSPMQSHSASTSSTGFFTKPERKSAVNKAFSFSEDEWVVSVLNTKERDFGGHSVILVEGLRKGELFVGRYDVISAIQAPSGNEDSRSSFFSAINPTGYISDVRVEETADYDRMICTLRLLSAEKDAFPSNIPMNSIILQKVNDQITAYWTEGSSVKQKLLNIKGTVLENKLNFPKIGKDEILMNPFHSKSFIPLIKEVASLCQYKHPHGAEFYAKCKKTSFKEPVANIEKMIQSIKEDKMQTELAQQGKASYLLFQRVGSEKAHGLLTLLSQPNSGINCAEWCIQKLAKAEIILDVKPTPNQVASAKKTTPDQVAGGSCSIL